MWKGGACSQCLWAIFRWLARIASFDCAGDELDREMRQLPLRSGCWT